MTACLRRQIIYRRDVLQTGCVALLKCHQEMRVNPAVRRSSCPAFKRKQWLYVFRELMRETWPALSFTELLWRRRWAELKCCSSWQCDWVCLDGSVKGAASSYLTAEAKWCGTAGARCSSLTGRENNTCSYQKAHVGCAAEASLIFSVLLSHNFITASHFVWHTAGSFI